ncbi:thioesterase family protein, partial [Pseudomonas aeruginosa]
TILYTSIERDGYGHVAARMWSADGQLLAISRQMVTVFG